MARPLLVSKWEQSLSPGSRSKLPRQHNAPNLDGATPVGLVCTALGLDSRPVPVHSNNTAAVKQPEQAFMVYANERPFSVAAE
jgi:hypothetical protein